ncbi:MAG: SUF system Fe-S cluster assembly protein [Rhodomicrobium sp.]|nr:SUF system Fe-S cluster assembly protein [Rhodomicrobium sp.]
MTDTMDQRKTLAGEAPWDGPQEPPAHKDLPQPCAHTVEAAKDFKAESAIPEEELQRMTQGIIAALKTVYDPEIPVDIYELGLIYKIDISDGREVDVEMTLTAPGCPVAGDMPAWVENAVGAIEGVKLVRVKLVFMPPWDPSRMSDEARVALNMF